jgi:hypothetical protein
MLRPTLSPRTGEFNTPIWTLGHDVDIDANYMRKGQCPSHHSRKKWGIHQEHHFNLGGLYAFVAFS